MSPTEPRPLTTLATGTTAAIHRIASSDPGRLVKLSSLGVLPGAEVTLLQRRPAVLLRIGESEIALDPEVAADIWVEPAGPAAPVRG